MSILALIGFCVVVAISGVVSFFCLGALVRRGGRIGSWGEFEGWRLIPCAVLLIPAGIGLFYARHSELRCERGGGVVACSIEQRQLRRSFHKLLPPNSVRSAEVEETWASDEDGFPELQTRLVVLTSEGRFRITDFGQRDAYKLHADLTRFLGDTSRREVVVGQDNRWFFYPQLPMWLLLSLFSLIGRF